MVILLRRVLPEGHSSDNDVDPVRYWPSGVPQGWTIVGTGLATFAALSKMGNCSPRVLGALSAMGVSATTVFYQTAIENPKGFNRFAYSVDTYIKTGHFPTLEEIKNTVLNFT